MPEGKLQMNWHWVEIQYIDEYLDQSLDQKLEVTKWILFEDVIEVVSLIQEGVCNYS